MSQDNDDKLIELYREGADEQPPPHLDNAIRAAAHREVQSKPHPAAPFGSSWWVPASVAAVLIVSVSVVVLMEPLPELNGTMDDVVKPQAKVETDTSGKVVVAQKEKPASAPLILEEEAKKRSQMVGEKLEARKDKAVVADAAPRQENFARPKPAERQLMAEDARVANVEQDTFSRAMSPAPTVGGAESEMADEARTDAPAAVAGMARSREAVGLMAKQARYPSPQDWLKDIDKLLEAGDYETAIKQLKDLQQAFPNFELPQRYRELLVNK